MARPRRWPAALALVAGLMLVSAFGLRTWHQWQYAQRVARGEIQVAEQVAASTSTLARHEAMYSQLRDDHQARVQQEPARVQAQALQEAEGVAVELLRRGVMPSVRRAGELTKSMWLPAQLRAVLLMEPRRVIGDPRVRVPLKAMNLGAALRTQVSETAKRFFAAVGERRGLQG